MKNLSDFKKNRLYKNVVNEIIKIVKSTGMTPTKKMFWHDYATLNIGYYPEL